MASTSDAATFYATFQSLKQDAVKALEVASVGEANTKIASLRDAFNEARPTLPPYDQRSYDLQLRELETRLSTLRAADKPKTRFAFSKRATASASASQPSSTPSPAPTPPVQETPSAESSTTYTLVGLQNTRVTPELYEPKRESTYTLTLADLDDCIVDLRDAHQDDPAAPRLTSLHARNLQRCIIIAPVLAGSVMLSELIQCIVVIGAQQFRLHSTTDTVVLLHVTSLPVIEQCNRVRFGPYPLPATGPSKHTEVQDFDWVRHGPSPHWSLLSAAECEQVAHKVINVTNDDTNTSSILRSIPCMSINTGS